MSIKWDSALLILRKLVFLIYRDVRVTQIYEGTSDVQRLVISREMLA